MLLHTQARSILMLFDDVLSGRCLDAQVFLVSDRVSYHMHYAVKHVHNL